MPGTGESYYELLNVKRDASPGEITASYRKLAKVLHPDVCNSPEAGELFKAINEAYQVLKDPKKREAYDLSLLEADESVYGSYYTGGQRYRDPRTWYYAHLHQSYHPPRDPYGTGSPMRREKKSKIPHFIQVILFYLTLLMAVVILVQLFLLPWMGGLAARDARNLFEEGNRWMDEEEYQKAIESYADAVEKLPGFSEGWRAKGLAELRKADELSEKGMDSQADPYYRSAVKSLEKSIRSFPDDIQILSGLGTALLMTGREKDAVPYLQEAAQKDPDNEKTRILLYEAQKKKGMQ